MKPMIGTFVTDRPSFPEGDLWPSSAADSKLYLAHRIRQLEAELHTRSRLLNETGMMIMTDTYGTIIYANDLFCSGTGFSRNRLIGQSHSGIRFPGWGQEAWAELLECLRSGRGWNGELKFRSAKGDAIWLQTVISPVPETDRSPGRFIWVQHDITSHKHVIAGTVQRLSNTEQQLLENVGYASYFHRAILPHTSELDESFADSFVIYEAKHLVSGDFYWFSRIGDESMIVLGDGTGHGVSAAMVSLMALTGLKYVVNELRITDPGTVLSKLNCFLFRAMNKHSGSGLTESVDMSFCRYNHKTGILDFACGRSKIALMRDNKLNCLSNGDCRGQSVSSDQGEIRSYTIPLREGDRIYMMSDGLADQFGGNKDKRFGSRRIRELLELTSQTPMGAQQELIRSCYRFWRGDNEQTDDITLVAFAIPRPELKHESTIAAQRFHAG